jgi:ArsR family transcriptional regulator
MQTLSIDHQVRVIKALAHPARLEIVQALAAGDRCVSELQALVGGDLSTVSKHLTLMRKAGWIDCQKQGQQVRYRLACDCLPTFLRCVEDIGNCRSGSACDC